jgi:glycosyltransferase involved in cell wall biosynthesis
MLGFRTDVADLLRASDVFVLPSLAEGFALSLIEALAAGLPVVATRVGGAPEVIENGVNGYLVPPGDPAALARAVVEILGQGDPVHAQMVKAARVTAARYSVDAMADRMFALYQEVSSHADLS